MKTYSSNKCQNQRLLKQILFDCNSMKKETLLLNRLICVWFSISELKKNTDVHFSVPFSLNMHGKIIVNEHKSFFLWDLEIRFFYHRLWDSKEKCKWLQKYLQNAKFFYEDKKIGKKYSDEVKDKIITQISGLRSNTYSFKVDNKKGMWSIKRIQKNKGKMNNYKKVCDKTICQYLDKSKTKGTLNVNKNHNV